MDAQALPLCRRGSRLLAFSPLCVKGQASRSWKKALAQGTTCAAAGQGSEPAAGLDRPVQRP
jgi:hypothetical protein